MTTDVSEIMSSYGGRRPDESNEDIVATMGGRKRRMGDVSPVEMTGEAGAAFSEALSGFLPDSTLTADDPDEVFTLDGSNNIVATAPDAGTYSVTVTETNPNAANSPHDTVVAITIS